MEKYIGVKVINAEPEQKDGQDGYKVVYPDGYVSWSPKVVFEEAYRITDEMTFGLAIEALKKGLKVSRKGWNGKGMWLKYIPMSDFGYTGMLPFIAMKCVDDNFIPWLASQSDVLAEDWTIVK